MARPQIIFDGSVLRIGARLGRRAADSPVFRFHLGDRVHDEKASVELGRARCRFTVPDVPIGNECYPLEYELLLGDRSFRGDQRYEVWPRRVTLKALRNEGGPAAGVPLRFSEAEGGGVERETRSDGTMSFRPREPGPVAVEVGSPFEALAWTETVGRHREVSVVRRCPAELVAPQAPPGGEIRQIVNRPSLDEGRDGLGPRVSLAVGLAGDRRRAAGERIGLEGDAIHLDVRFRGAPSPGGSGFGLSGVGDLRLSEGGRRQRGRVELGPAGEPARFEVRLDPAGGSACEIAIGSTAECSEAALRIVSWRELTFELTHPEGADPELPAGSPAALEAAFLRCECARCDPVADDAGAPPGVWREGAELGLERERALVIGAHDLGVLHERFAGERGPGGFHVLLADALDDLDDPAAPTATRARIGADVLSDGRLVVSVGTCHPRRRLLSIPVGDGEASPVLGSWRGRDAGEELAADAFELEPPPRGGVSGRVSIRLPEPALRAMEAEGEIDVCWQLPLARGPLAAHSVAGDLLLVSRESSLERALVEHLRARVAGECACAAVPGEPCDACLERLRTADLEEVP